MTLIAVKGVPLDWNMRGIMVTLAPEVKGPFEGIGPFVFNENRTTKICYIKLSSTLDPLKVIERINARGVFKNATLNAFIPTNKPRLIHNGLCLPGPPLKIPGGLKYTNQQPDKTLMVPFASHPEQVLLLALKELLIEMQCKFTSLYGIAKMNPTLIPEIAKIIFQRLRVVMDTSILAGESSVALTKFYRIAHPHFADFQLILSTLHRVQDAAGVPREQLVESEMCKPPASPYVIDNVPYEAVKASYAKHSTRISKKMVDHIKNLKSDVNLETDSEEEKARKKVRAELKKLAVYIPWIVKQAVITHIMPEKSPTHRIRVYGEPKIPKISLLQPLFKPFDPFRVSRSQCIYNMLKFNVQPLKHDLVMSLDGSEVAGCKLIFRTSDVPVWDVPEQMKADMAKALGVEGVALETEDMDIDEDDDFTEEY